ncbi:hypothetical protein [Kineosporia sp. A_224]|uniref:hypothetical protein n=1 Tax=Kineosporia sp. A_224 TaxID=1962180 RepID=UPI000B4B5424|nr:hypothetical protein [Kineosporia sp. A_224]
MRTLTAAPPEPPPAEPGTDGSLPLSRFIDRYAVADLVTVLAGEAGHGYPDDLEAAALVIFESVVDAVLTVPLAATLAHGPASRGPDEWSSGLSLEATRLLLDDALHLDGLWPVPAWGRDADRSRPDRVIRLLVDAFTPYVDGGADTLRARVDARVTALAHIPHAGALASTG